QHQRTHQIARRQVHGAALPIEIHAHRPVRSDARGLHPALSQAVARTPRTPPLASAKPAARPGTLAPMPTHPDAAGIAFAWRPTQDDLEAFFSDRLRNGHAYAFSRRQIRAARSLLLVGLLAGATGTLLLVADNALGGMFLFFGVAATLLTLRPALLPTRTLHRRALPHF